MAKINSTTVISIIIYTLVVLSFIFAVHCERKDVQCTSFRSKTCGPGLGSSYAAGRPERGDTVKDLLRKIRITSRYEVNSILWRRAYFAAVISAFVVMYVCKKKIPSGLQFGTAFLIIYIVIYLTLTLFQKWITEPALGQLDQLLKKIKDKNSYSNYSL